MKNYKMPTSVVDKLRRINDELFVTLLYMKNHEDSKEYNTIKEAFTMLNELENEQYMMDTES